MTTKNPEIIVECPKEYLLKLLTGKWKPCIFRYATQGPVRFGQISRLLPEATKQGLTNALRELESANIVERRVIQEKPLHVEYHLTELGIEFIPIFNAIEALHMLPTRKQADQK
ncbi:winged helix-turn-helix transcriptional regulator [Chryseolinea lacunae]|uniref:Helix-turn-helix transcriptional regulator n=1 Tax=Chryseolinea lacunae TaxID=2801331 RepID=A0ABS1L214_9BACT|nr:helix-turn-helix domain-containing protein [Chryseolinea lacunae]MBL0745758.1 helix-turn-helix transcriptional regulator [Chryseolinea lacunae]